MERAFEKLNSLQADFHGEFIGLAGNLKALEMGCRYLDQDLNRIWNRNEITNELIKPDGIAESSEFAEIWQIIRQAAKKRKGEMVFIDLHTTSSESPPFCLIGDTMRNRRFVADFPVPVILGLEEQLEGPLLSYLNELGFISFGFEAGQHSAEISTTNHENMLWMVLEKAGCLKREKIPWFENARSEISAQTQKLQKVFEIRYRHGVVEGNNFIMNPGYSNFQKIRKDEELAWNRMGAVKAKLNGRIFMPLYQPQGDDGFFVIKRIAGFWLGISAILRSLGMWRMLPLLPGVRKDKIHPNTLVLNTRIARFFGREIFHLMGYRKRRALGQMVTYSRRTYDIHPPELP